MSDKSDKQVKEQVQITELNLSQEKVAEILDAIRTAREDMVRWQEDSKPTPERMREPVSL